MNDNIEPIIMGVLHYGGKFISALKVHSAEGICPTVVTTHPGIGQIKIEVLMNEDRTEKLPEMKEGDVCAMLTPGREVKRQNGGRFKNDGTSFVVTCQDKHGIAYEENEHLRIRYLTPKECLRLMGQSDEAIEKIRAAEPSKTVQYRLAGNSIVVDVLEAIFKGIYIDESFTKPKIKQTTIDDWE